MRRASRPNLAFEVRPDPIPPPVREDDTDPDVTFACGQHWRDERSVAKGDRDNVITSDERAVMHAHQLAQAEARQASKDASLARAVELGAALKVLAGEDG